MSQPSRGSAKPLPYDSKDKYSILEHALAARGRTITEVIDRALIPPSVFKPTNKGAIGNIIQECLFGIRCNSRKEVDFEEANLELKIIPLEKASQGYRVKERTKICLINYTELIHEKWSTSHAKSKLNSILFLYYIYDPLVASRSRIHHADIWTLDKRIEAPIISEDWSRVQAMVCAGRAHELSETLSRILAATTTGSGHGATVAQPNPLISGEPPVRAKPRAFTLKQAFTKQRWLELAKNVQYETIRMVLPDINSDNFESKIIEKLSKFVGKSLQEISETLDIPSPKGKNAAATIVKKAIGFKNVNARIKEFEQLGLHVRIVPVQEGSLRPLEATSFPTMKLKEFVEEDWDEATLREFIEFMLFIPVLSKGSKMPLSKKIVGRPFFWRPSESEMRIIGDEWARYQEQVKKGKAKTHVEQHGKKKVRVTDLMKSSETDITHIRPHAKDGTDMDVDPFGNKVVKQSFWLNQNFIHQLVQKAYQK